MEKVNGESLSTLTDDEWKKLIEDVDSKTQSPEGRANWILDLIKQSDRNQLVTTYDLWCFAIHILQTLMVQYTVITPSVKILHKLLYQLHYRLQLWRQIKDGLPSHTSGS